MVNVDLLVLAIAANAQITVVVTHYVVRIIVAVPATVDFVRVNALAIILALMLAVANVPVMEGNAHRIVHRIIVQVIV